MLAHLGALPGLDVRQGLEFTPGSDPGFYLQMLRLFLDSYRDSGEKLQECLASGDVAAAERLVHNCKGSAATLGAAPLASAAADLERALRAGGRGEAIAPQAQAFAGALEEIVAGLDKALAASA